MIDRATHWMQLIATRQDSAGVWGRFDNQRPEFGIHEMIILGSVALLLAGTLVWQAMKRRRQREFWFNSASRLFGELCRSHHLDRSSRRLLKHLAAARGLKNATELFVEPEYFDMTSLPLALKPSASELRQLRHTLFALHSKV